MLYYNSIDVSEGVDTKKTSASKECDICHYWYFLGKGSKFQLYACNGCHDVFIMSMNLWDVAVLNIKGAYYCCITTRISKSEAINIMQNIVFSEKKWIIIKYKSLFSHMKMGK